MYIQLVMQEVVYFNLSLAIVFNKNNKDGNKVKLILKIVISYFDGVLPVRRTSEK